MAVAWVARLALLSNIISKYYQQNSKTENLDWLCNCWNKENCPLDGKCLRTCIVDVIINKDSHIYYGASDGEFKSWYNNHINLFRHRHHKQDTELSKHIWKLQDKGINLNGKWGVAAYASTYRCGLRRCDLYLTEKYVKAKANHKSLLNKRTELFSKCRERNKYILKNIK